ncbi:glycerophosphodiester phosphodiesterase family protein [Micromonospora chaiyaphumensis]|uniref:Glycerophosphoryl diester phosphodiesterase n=1 Tax=Micromonospora chaiyaphumensis TaxID=307119 RepID=A0A1C4US73_9ACTN|nr:glycerophosphodiester phosphodiesterase family protein [Micromonospora chaiyaphumensis]SCE74494.1 glycerophosphoryl diester phosphodiesterase [Micromonospora chaiyaphumensis]
MSASVSARGPVATYAHRGSSGMAPENTAAAFERAIAEGADCIETDVQLSADGELVIIHDVTLPRTTDARLAFADRAPWNVHDFTLAELRKLDAGGWYDDDFTGQHILTFDELLDLLGDRVGLNLELKSPAANPGLAHTVAARLRRRRDRPRPLIVGSFDEQALRDFHAQLPDVPVALIAYDVPASGKLTDLAEWVFSVNPDIRRLRAEDVARVIEAGMAVVPWTADSPELWRWAIDAGAEGMITNYPYALTTMLHGRDPLPGAVGVVVQDVVPHSPGDEPQWAGEHVVLRNVSGQPVDVSGWYLRSQSSERIAVGDGYVIPAGGLLRVWTGPGTDGPTSYHNGRTTAVWNGTKGDSAGLHRADGAIADLYAYVV